VSSACAAVSAAAREVRDSSLARGRVRCGRCNAEQTRPLSSSVCELSPAFAEKPCEGARLDVFDKECVTVSKLANKMMDGMGTDAQLELVAAMHKSAETRPESGP
jgi:hypothetical protein